MISSFIKLLDTWRQVILWQFVRSTLFSPTNMSQHLGFFFFVSSKISLVSQVRRLCHHGNAFHSVEIKCQNIVKKFLLSAEVDKSMFCKPVQTWQIKHEGCDLNIIRASFCHMLQKHQISLEQLENCTCPLLSFKVYSRFR